VPTEFPPRACPSGHLARPRQRHTACADQNDMGLLGLRTLAHAARVAIFAATSCDAAPRSTEQCLPFPGNDQEPFSTPVSGMVKGASVSAVSCPGGVSARIFPSVSTSVDPFTFFLSGSPGGSNASHPPDFVFQYPLGAVGYPLATLGLASATPGDYSSSTGADCDGVSFTYETPLSLTVDCNAGTPPDCPAGCTTVCGITCSPCEPDGTTTIYQAFGSSDCSSTQTNGGSWKLSLTSVVPDDAGAGQFIAHGTLNATLIGPGCDGDTAELSLAF
jgi:hypothetical protein